MVRGASCSSVTPAAPTPTPNPAITLPLPLALALTLTPYPYPYSYPYPYPGDPQQLPATVLSLEAKRLGLGRSLFERLQRSAHPVTMLQTQVKLDTITNKP